jgi:putative nucleotidyltransferase with HDIG domain
MVWGWLRLLEMRDAETEGHSERVTTLTLHLANYFGLSANERDMVRWGALLHDIGKMGVPDSILLKPSALTADEWKVMKMHPVYAYEMLSSIPLLQSATHIPYCHHEKWDGSGYPRGLQAEEIPFSARIFAVIDVWDALCSERPYRAAWSPERAMGFIYSESGMHFDPMVVAGFMECYTQDPTAFRSRH